MSVLNTHPGNLSILELEIPGREPVPAGVLLEDPSQDRLYLRLRRDWEALAPGEAATLSGIEFSLSAWAAEMGAKRLLSHLEDTLSNILRMGERREVMVEGFPSALARLYREHIQS